MALSEPQIERYSRQILLRAVGGIGQERLLASAIRVEAQGLAATTAAAYLAAAGSAVNLVHETAFEERGFLVGPPVALSSLPVRAVLRLAGVPPSDESGLHRVVLGKAEMGYAAAHACAQCSEQALAVTGQPPPSVLVGSAAALCLQALLLGQREGAGKLVLREDSTCSESRATCTHGGKA